MERYELFSSIEMCGWNSQCLGLIRTSDRNIGLYELRSIAYSMSMVPASLSILLIVGVHERSGSLSPSPNVFCLDTDNHSENLTVSLMTRIVALGSLNSSYMKLSL